MTKEKIEVEKGSGNIFEDLEIPNPEEYLVKTRLALIIKGIITESGLKQREAAKYLTLVNPNFLLYWKDYLMIFLFSICFH